jgi:hypothetical protein
LALFVCSVFGHALLLVEPANGFDQREVARRRARDRPQWTREQAHDGIAILGVSAHRRGRWCVRRQESAADGMDGALERLAGSIVSPEEAPLQGRFEAALASQRSESFDGRFVVEVATETPVVADLLEQAHVAPVVIALGLFAANEVSEPEKGNLG